MRNLRSLTFQYFGDNSLRPLPLADREDTQVIPHEIHMSILTAIQQIVSTNIPLQHLYLNSIIYGSNVDQLVGEILKLKELESLTCGKIRNLTESHVSKFCKHLLKLRHFAIELNIRPSLGEITKWIGTADKLETLYVGGVKTPNRGRYRIYELQEHHIDLRIIVTSDTHKEWVEIVEKRRDRTHLSLTLDYLKYTTSLTPTDLTETSVRLAFKGFREKRCLLAAN